MKNAKVNGVKLENEVVGSGEPVPPTQPELAPGRHLFHNHKRGWVSSTHTPPRVSVTVHTADAAALLDHLGVPRAHVAGDSSGATVAAQQCDEVVADGYRGFPFDASRQGAMA